MSNQKSFSPRKRFGILAGLLGVMVLPTQTTAEVTGPVSLATAPLINSTSSKVKPNLLFTLDDSGSMARDYTPDWVDDFTSHGYKVFTNAGFNATYYNPAITYNPPVTFKADGSLD